MFVKKKEKQKSDNFPLNQWGVGRCTEERAGNRIKERTSIFLKDEDSRFNFCNKVNILLAGSHDVYAADVYYHQSCYLKYTVNKIAGNAESNKYEETSSANILDDFLFKVERCIIFYSSAFLLSNLMKEFMKLYKNYGICPLIDNTKELKRRLIEKFDEKIGFFPSGKQLIVFLIEVNPCQYSVATLDGFGLSDNELYNAIYTTINPSFKVHSTGYAVTPSHQSATKIWSIASDWEYLVTKKKTSKQVLTGSNFHLDFS